MATLIKSIWAGIAIAIGAMVYVNIGGPMGALFFSIGLLMVFFLKLKLYTGVVGFTINFKDIQQDLLILAGNFIGTWISLLIEPTKATEIVNLKLSIPWYALFLKAALCGAIIYTAVVAYRAGHWGITLIAVPAFILSGSEHSIADMCYIIAARAFSLKSAVLLGIVILGNAAGAIALHQSLTYKKKIDIINV